MSETSRFTAESLYPGAGIDTDADHPDATQNGFRLVVDDPYPDDSLRPNNIYRVTLPYATVIPLIWNSKEWTTSFAVDLNITGIGGTINGSFSLDGKYLSSQVTAVAQSAFYHNNAIAQFTSSSSIDEPLARTVGEEHYDNKQYLAEFPDPILETPGSRSVINSPRLLPSASLDCQLIEYFGSFSGPSIVIPSTIQNEDDEEIGNATLTMSGSDFGVAVEAEIEAAQLWVKEDGEIDLFVRIDFLGGADFGEFIGIFSQSTDIPGYSYIGNATLTILGVEVTGFVFVPTGLLDVFPGVAVTATVGYNVTQDEAWEYPT